MGKGGPGRHVRRGRAAPARPARAINGANGAGPGAFAESRQDGRARGRRTCGAGATAAGTFCEGGWGWHVPEGRSNWARAAGAGGSGERCEGDHPSQDSWPVRTLWPGKPPGTRGMARQAAPHKRYGPARRPAHGIWPGKTPGTRDMARQATPHKRYGPARRPAREVWAVPNIVARQAAQRKRYGPSRTRWPGRPPGARGMARPENCGPSSRSSEIWPVKTPGTRDMTRQAQERWPVPNIMARQATLTRGMARGGQIGRGRTGELVRDGVDDRTNGERGAAPTGQWGPELVRPLPAAGSWGHRHMAMGREQR